MRIIGSMTEQSPGFKVYSSADLNAHVSAFGHSFKLHSQKLVHLFVVIYKTNYLLSKEKYPGKMLILAEKHKKLLDK